MTARRFSSDFALQIRIAAMEDLNYQRLLADHADSITKESSDKSITVEDGLLFVNYRWPVPESKEIRNIILHAEHDSIVAGHFGQFKTLERVKANFHWLKMDLDVEVYIHNCDSCQCNKTVRYKKFGLLDPFDIPNRPWDEISMDFIVALPGSNSYTKIWVIVDRFTKMAHFLPLSTDNPIKDLANLYLKEVWRVHGLPSKAVFDRDSRFQSKFWLSLMELKKVDIRLSTVFHPQMNG
jgi:hypothetical protein